MLTNSDRSAICDLLEPADWEMAYSERLALEGLVSSIKPRVAVEIGSAQGGSLARTAIHSEQVHSFDINPVPDASAYPNVVFHHGDSHKLLAPWLATVREAGQRINYALVDGDHSADGARQDLQDLLGAGVMDGMILVHDTHNPEVRRGVESVEFETYPDVTYVHIAFMPGNMTRAEGPAHNQLWGGFGLVIVDPDRRIRIPDVILPAGSGIRQQRFHDPLRLVKPMRFALRASSKTRRTARRMVPGR